MTEAERLEKVKNGLGITGDFQDNTLQVYINDVMEFMKSAGVKPDVVKSELAIGCIIRGVSDLWNYGSGSASLSNYFKQRLLQLKQSTISEEV